jgi:C-terminal processing protease CtpA/Prc
MDKIINNIKKNAFLTFLTLFTTLIIIQNPVKAQNESRGKLLDTEGKVQTINSISELLNNNYIFPEVAKKMGDYVSSQLNSGAYENITDPMEFAQQMTNDLLSISKDKHIRVGYSPQQVKEMREMRSKQLRPEEEDRLYLEQLKSDNFGFKKVEVLPGNVGYIDFRYFGPGHLLKEKVASVMGFVENCDALIFDMRYNGGGDPTGIQLICSYLFGDKPVHLNDLYFRPRDTTEEFWTLEKIDGNRMPDVPVYVLTSSFTFSGAEEFSYNLKNLDRATIVGQTTGGGAHPGGTEIVNDDFIINIPTGRAINPYTKTNWEGTGVSPDIEIDSRDALIKSHILALEKITASVSDARRKDRINFFIESLNGALNVSDISMDILKSYEGTYGERKITYENGKLFYQRSWRQTYEMTPISDDTFMIMDIDYFRVKFDKDSNGNVTGITGIYDDGHTDNTPKN